MKTDKRKILKTAVMIKRLCAPLILLFYPVSVVLMFVVVGLLTSHLSKTEHTRIVNHHTAITSHNKLK